MLVPQKVKLALEKKDTVTRNVENRRFYQINRNVPTYLKVRRDRTWRVRISHVGMVIII